MPAGNGLPASGVKLPDADGVAEHVAAREVGDVNIGAGGVAGDGGRLDAGRKGRAAQGRENAARADRESEDISDVGRDRRVVSGDVDIGAGGENVDGGGHNDVRCVGAGESQGQYWPLTAVLVAGRSDGRRAWCRWRLP